MIKIRKLLPNDVEFITSTWLKNYRSNSDTAKKMKNDVYFPEHHKLIHDALVNFKVLVACNPDMPDQVFAWIVFDNKGYDLIHYSYCKKIYRDFPEVMPELMKRVKTADICIYTHDSQKKDLNKFYEPKNMVFNPYMFLNENYFK